MLNLHQKIDVLVKEWRQKDYRCDYPAIREVFKWAKTESENSRYLRSAQFHALETYWYLRLVENTPLIIDLYRKLFTRKADLKEALGIPDEAFAKVDYDLDEILRKIGRSDEFVREFRFEALRETLALDYPSYILALAMGAGKTVLIGAIIATEFAMALEYQEAPFIQNALVFAPGKTIIESLRELSEVPYDKILPPRFYKRFASTVKLTFTRDGEKDIPVIARSVFNIVVTNTEKIRIQKETIRKSDIGYISFSSEKEDEARTEIANLRLQKIASLPHLGIFSDEAHHTYGQALGDELKKVRKTVDYLHSKTNVICVINTTGTPYYQRQPLRDVVIWYGLSEGIRDGILKEVSDNIQSFDFDDTQAGQFVAHVVEDFFRDYGDVSLPNGSRAKLAIYFPQIPDLNELRPVIETKLVEIGISPSVCLQNTNESTQEEIDAFNRLNTSTSIHRVVLLVNKGTEGWNCPSLFACALARRLRHSNNFVLQAASRCLRQIPGNAKKARIYLSNENLNTLDRELQETYGETIADLNRTNSNSRKAIIRLRKINLPPLVIKKVERKVVRKSHLPASIHLTKPTNDAIRAGLKKTILVMAIDEVSRHILKQVGDTVEITTTPETIDCYSAAIELSAIYRVAPSMIYEELKRVYDSQAFPSVHIPILANQIEEQTRNYEVVEEVVEVALALVKPGGFNKEIADDGSETYTAEIAYLINREDLLLSLERFKETNKLDFGFHYTPYNFDSKPESNFFTQLLTHINLHPSKIEDIYFTGALTDPNKTDFYVEYRGDDGEWHRYTPDFIIRRKDGKCLIVEIKNAQFQASTENDLQLNERGEPVITLEGRKAVALKKWEKLNSDRIKYELLFVKDESVPYNQTQISREFIEE